mgnify:CR=1 FL=1
MLNIEDMYLEMGIRKEVYDFGTKNVLTPLIKWQNTIS